MAADDILVLNLFKGKDPSFYRSLKAVYTEYEEMREQKKYNKDGIKTIEKAFQDILKNFGKIRKEIEGGYELHIVQQHLYYIGRDLDILFQAGITTAGQLKRSLGR